MVDGRVISLDMEILAIIFRLPKGPHKVEQFWDPRHWQDKKRAYQRAGRLLPAQRIRCRSRLQEWLCTAEVHQSVYDG